MEIITVAHADRGFTEVLEVKQGSKNSNVEKAGILSGPIINFGFSFSKLLQFHQEVSHHNQNYKRPGKMPRYQI